MKTALFTIISLLTTLNAVAQTDTAVHKTTANQPDTTANTTALVPGMYQQQRGTTCGVPQRPTGTLYIIDGVEVHGCSGINSHSDQAIPDPYLCPLIYRRFYEDNAINYQPQDAPIQPANTDRSAYATVRRTAIEQQVRSLANAAR